LKRTSTRFRIALVALAVAVAQAPSARAQVFGQFTPAPPLEVNGRMFGGYLQFSENVLNLVGQLRLSFYPSVDFGFQGALARQEFGGGEDRTTIGLGGDIKYQVARADAGAPVALSVGATIGVQTGDNFSILSVGPTVVGSRTLPAGETVSLTPYVGLGMLFSSINVGDFDDSDFSIPLRIGTTLKLNPGLDLMAELQFRLANDFDDDMSTTIGVNAPF
jgi:hypothetical protein